MNAIVDILMESSYLNQQFFQNRFYILGLFMCFCILSLLLICLAILALESKTITIKEKTLIGIPAALIATFAFSAAISLALIPRTIEENYGQYAGIYYSTERTVFIQKEDSSLEKPLLNRTGVVNQKKTLLEFKKLGEIDCEGSLRECNEYLRKNKDAVITKLKEKHRKENPFFAE